MLQFPNGTALTTANMPGQLTVTTGGLKLSNAPTTDPSTWTVSNVSGAPQFPPDRAPSAALPRFKT